MNLLILLLFVGMVFYSPITALGIATGIGICYVMEDAQGKTNIMKKLTTWKWFDVFA